MHLASFWLDSVKIKIFIIFIIFCTFLWHISSPSPVFPWSNWAHIEPAQSSNIVFKVLLRICQSVKYFYQKYMVKGSKLRTSAGRPKTSRRPADGWSWTKVLRTMSTSIWKIQLFSKNLPKFTKSSVRPGVSRHEYFVLLFLHELT